METFSALLAISVGNSSVTGEFPAQRPVTRSFDVFFDLCLNKRLSKQSWGRWFETPLRPLWRLCNVVRCVGGWYTEILCTTMCWHIKDLRDIRFGSVGGRRSLGQQSTCMTPWASYQIRWIAGCAYGERFPRHRLQRVSLVNDPGMHNDSCVTHVPLCMSG